MRIFVTGSTGYIGQHLIMRLAAEGHSIHALCRSGNNPNLVAHPKIKFFKGDILDLFSLEKAMSGCEQVYHLAAFAKPWAKDPSIYFKINVDGTRNVLETAKRLQVQKILFTSTAGVLGPSRESPVREDDPRWGSVMNDYEASKTEAEAICRQYVRDFNMHIVIVNPPRVYGPGVDTESNGVTRLIKLYLRRKWRFIPGNGNAIGSYVHVKDVVNGHVLAMEKGRCGERYILSGENVSFNDFFSILASVSGISRKMISLPLWLMLLAGNGMLFMAEFMGKSPLITPKWIRKYLYNWSLSCEKAERELGYSFIPLEEGLKDTIEWINKNKL